MKGERNFSSESRKESSINLSTLAFDFYADDQIKSYYDQKLSDINDREKWIEKKQRKINSK